jgi:hypothetical protein
MVGENTMSEESKADAVGYKRPPAAHQFRPGQSGNPNRRPKGARNFKSELREELNELVTFRDGDRDVEISKQRALIKRLVATALAGDQRAAAALLGICTRMFAADEETEEAPDDREIMDEFTKRNNQRRIAARKP